MSGISVTYHEFIIRQKTCHFRVWSKTEKLYTLGGPVWFQAFSPLTPFQDKPEISWILKHNIHDPRLLPHPLHGELYHSVCLNTFRAVASHQLVQLFVVLIGEYVNELRINFKSPQIQICSTGVTFLSYGETESPFRPESESILIKNMHKSLNLFYGGSITSFFHHQQLLTNLWPQLQCLLLYFIKTARYWLAGRSLFFSQRDDLVINSSYD